MAIDAQWSNVVLLLPLSSDLLDVKSHAVTAYGSAALSSSVGDPFGAGNALSLNGTSQYLGVTDSADFSLGSGDFSIESWIYFTSHASEGVIVGQRNGPGSDLSFVFMYHAASGSLRFSYATDGTTTINVDRSWSPSDGVWYFLSAVRNGTVLQFRVDGVQLGSDYTIGASSIYNSSSQLKIGAFSTTPASFFSGYIGPVRISRAARTITAAPTSAFPRPSLSGVVYDDLGSEVDNVVVAVKRSTLALAGYAVSDAVTGEYTIYPSDFSEHIVMRFDTATYPLVDGGSGENAAIYDRVIPG